MSTSRTITVDGNEAAASVAYRLNEVISIYPITPSSAMGELADEWAVQRKPNLFGNVPSVTEMQSEGGAAGTVHGALQAGALATTFTSSQGLLLMIPNMYKIAGELTAYCMHVAARTLATHALSIFGDHSDVMACRQIGFGMLASSSVQEAHDFACIGQAASLASRVPFLHFFDGFRTSHEVAKIEELSDEDLRHLMNPADIQAHRDRALTPDHPMLRGSAQNPDVFFQAREACNSFYDACPETVQRMLDRFAERTGRRYRLFDYYGHPEAERVVVLMGSGAETARDTVERLSAQGERVGALAVRLFRPFHGPALLQALPATVRSVAVLDRTKEPGAVGEPLYMDVLTTLRNAEDTGTLPLTRRPVVIGGRYGLSSKEFTPAMVCAVLQELTREKPRNGFTVGITDDVTHRSLEVDPELVFDAEDLVQAVFFGLGSDGTVGANKNSIKIIGEETDLFVQGYFVYDSKKSGAMTVSHLRFGPRPIRAPYLIRHAGFVACHQFAFLERLDIVEYAQSGGTLLLNSPFGPHEVWDLLPREVQEEILARDLKLFVIDANHVAQQVGLGGRINTIMQTCFFALSGVLPRQNALDKIKGSIDKTYGQKGTEVVRRNHAAVDAALEHLHQVTLPHEATSTHGRLPMVSEDAPDFVQKVTAVMLAGKGDHLPVSAFPVDGTWPMGTSQWEKRNVALQVPLWDEEICIQCNKCVLVCPHAAIRAKVYEPEKLAGAPQGFRSCESRLQEFPDKRYTIQLAPEDCTGCNLCVVVCPAKDRSNPRHKALNMQTQTKVRRQERANYSFFLGLPDVERTDLERIDVKTSQLLEPLFEYSGACAGCGETPYVKLLTQLFGDRALIANATGCSSIYGGNLPTTPYRTNADGRGPAWSNSLFEDNAEFGLGFRLAVDAHRNHARHLLQALSADLGDELVRELLEANQDRDVGIQEQRKRVIALRAKLERMDDLRAQRLRSLADYLVRKSVWLMGGDGWAFDIGYGGLDHVMSTQHDVNILVLDTEVYSNTGGQASKATPLGAVAKFAAGGKTTDKKDLGLMAMSYGHVYVASIAFGAKDAHTVKTFLEAESYRGPSLIIAYSHCIAHGYDMAFGAEQQMRAVRSGIWPLYRFDPRRSEKGEPALIMDAAGGKIPVHEYMKNEARFRMVEKLDPEQYRRFGLQAQEAAARRVAIYQHMAELRLPRSTGNSGNSDTREA